MEHFGAVFKLNLTEETRMQLQEEEAIALLPLALASFNLLESIARIGIKFKFKY